MELQNLVFISGKQIIGYKKAGKNNFVIFEDGSKIPKNDLRKTRAKIKCLECLEFKEIFLYFNIFEKKYICQSCNKKGDKNGFYGKTHSQKTKDLISKTNSGRAGELNYMYGKRLKDVITSEGFENMRKKVSERNKERANNPFRKPMRVVIGEEGVKQARIKAKLSVDSWSEEKRREYLEKLRKSQKLFQEKDPKAYFEMKSRAGKISASNREIYKINKFESKVQQWINENGLESEYSIIMNNGKRNFQFDFKIKEKRILIECNGGYWHGDPRFYNVDGSDGKIKLNNIQLDKIEMDKQKLEFALKKNFVLLTVWEFDVMENNDFRTLEEGILL